MISGNGSGVVLIGPFTEADEIEGNEIGADASGTVAIGNTLFGVWIYNGASYDEVGGTAAGAGNLITGNGGYGVGIFGSQTTGIEVKANTITHNNAGGVEIASSASDNEIGKSYVGTGNLISYNQGDGIDITGAGTTGNRSKATTLAPTPPAFLRAKHRRRHQHLWRARQTTRSAAPTPARAMSSPVTR